MDKSRRKVRTISAKKKGLIIVLGLIFILVLGVGIYGYRLLDKVDNVDISKEDEDLGIDEEIVKDMEDKGHDVTNIALFGIDKAGLSGNARSDSMIIASIDRKNGVVKLTSLMRDTYIDIPGRGMDKMGHAYAFGGPELAIKTINQNFNMDIREFMTVDFTGFEKIVDSLGGVEIDISQVEANHMGLASSGRQLLDGKQALAYSRIRKVGHGDYERTERQRTVLEEAFKKMLNIHVLDYPKVLNTLLPLVETSLSKTQILNLGTDMVKHDIRDMEQFRLPADEYLSPQMINQRSVLVPMTLEDNVNLLKAFIYGDESVGLSE